MWFDSFETNEASQIREPPHMHEGMRVKGGRDEGSTPQNQQEKAIDRRKQQEREEARHSWKMWEPGTRLNGNGCDMRA